MVLMKKARRSNMKSIISNTKNKTLNNPPKDRITLEYVDGETISEFNLWIKDITTFSFEGATPNSHNFRVGEPVHQIDTVIDFAKPQNINNCYSIISNFWQSVDFYKQREAFEDIIAGAYTPTTKINDFGDFMLKKDFKTGMFRAKFCTDYLPNMQPQPSEEMQDKGYISLYRCRLGIVQIRINRYDTTQIVKLPLGKILNIPR